MSSDTALRRVSSQVQQPHSHSICLPIMVFVSVDTLRPTVRDVTESGNVKDGGETTRVREELDQMRDALYLNQK